MLRPNTCDLQQPFIITTHFVLTTAGGLSLLAHQAGSEVSVNELATQLQMARPTVARYLELPDSNSSPGVTHAQESHHVFLHRPARAGDGGADALGHVGGTGNRP